MLNIGLDVHQRSSALCILGPRGQVIKRESVKGHPRLIFRSKHKNDRADAQKLAKLLYLDEVSPVYVPSSQTRSRRGFGGR